MNNERIQKVLFRPRQGHASLIDRFSQRHATPI
jgi:hypothetical protein